jgi:hypothetical protein
MQMEGLRSFIENVPQPLVAVSPSKKAKNKSGALRKDNVCRRCGIIKYKGLGKSHGLHCSDGVRATWRRVGFPQPSDLFVNDKISALRYQALLEQAELAPVVEGAIVNFNALRQDLVFDGPHANATKDMHGVISLIVPAAGKKKSRSGVDWTVARPGWNQAAMAFKEEVEGAQEGDAQELPGQEDVADAGAVEEASDGEFDIGVPVESLPGFDDVQW